MLDTISGTGNIFISGAALINTVNSENIDCQQMRRSQYVMGSQPLSKTNPHFYMQLPYQTFNNCVLEGSLIRLSLNIVLILSNNLTEGSLGTVKLTGGHGHSGGYDQLLFGRLRYLIDIKGWITDYA